MIWFSLSLNIDKFSCLVKTTIFPGSNSYLSAMFLLDKPFVSDFLIESIRENDFRVIATEQARKIAGDRIRC